MAWLRIRQRADDYLHPRKLRKVIMPTTQDLHTLIWIFVSGGIGFFTGIAVTLSYEDLLDKKRRKTIKRLKARLAEAEAQIDQNK